MNEIKAEIVGFLCAEGCYVKSCRVFSELDKRKGNVYFRIRNSRVIEFGNTNPILLKRFIYLLGKEYDYKPNPSSNNTKIVIGRVKIVEDLLKYSNYGTFKWSVPSELFNSPIKSKYAFLRGFIDGDGTIGRGCIRLDSANKSGLLQISGLVKTIKINHSFHGPIKSKNKSDMYNIYIGIDESKRILKYLKPNKTYILK